MSDATELPAEPTRRPDLPIGLERWISRILLAGVVLSAMLLLLGTLLLLTREGVDPVLGPVRIDWHGLAGSFAALDPYAVIGVGLLVLILTPFFRVVISVAAYVWNRDLPFVVMTLFVLLVLVASVVAGVAL
jgi:uncharacterized membrane protein